MVILPSKIIFAVFASNNPAQLGAKINQIFPGNYIALSHDQWLIAAEGTAQNISDTLGITTGQVGNAIVVSISGYFGRQPNNVWEWIATKWQG